MPDAADGEEAVSKVAAGAATPDDTTTPAEWIARLEARIQELAPLARAGSDWVSGDVRALRGLLAEAPAVLDAARLELDAGRDDGAAAAARALLLRLADFRHLRPDGQPLAGFLKRSQSGSRTAKAVYALERDGCPPLEFVFVSGGVFSMGSGLRPSESPVHERQIEQAFYLGRGEVTRGEYLAYCDAAGSAPPAPPLWGDDPQFPIVGVSAEEAHAFCAWVGGRLPTEHEWEFAAQRSATDQATARVVHGDPQRGGARHPLPLGRSTDTANAGDTPRDLLGNVLEWCAGFYDRHAYARHIAGEEPRTSPFGVVRGGSFANDVSQCRPAARFRQRVDARSPLTGFRVLLPAVDETPVAVFAADDLSPGLRTITPTPGSVHPANVVVKGQLVPAAEWSLTYSGEAVTLDPNGRFEHTVTLEDGTNDVVLVGRRSGVESRWLLTLEGDTRVPELVLLEPASSRTTTEEDRLIVRGLVQGRPVDFVDVLAGYQIPVDEEGQFEFAFVVSSLGVQQVPLVAEDQYGNRSEVVLEVEVPEPHIEYFIEAERAEAEALWTNGALPDGLERGDERGIFLWRLPSGARLEMVYVPSGPFRMGLDGESYKKTHPAHDHPLPVGYFLARDETTRMQFMDFVAATKREEPNIADLIPEDGSDRPMSRVTWTDARGFCEWAGLSLPTEAQWEKAAHGGHDYAEWLAGEQAFHDTHLGIAFVYVESVSSKGEVMPARSRRDHSAYGLWDMTSGLEEWCADVYDENSYSRYATGDFTQPAEGEFRVTRNSRVGRAKSRPDWAAYNLGFRAALNLR